MGNYSKHCKVYTIVTNDAEQKVVKSGVVGTREVADFIGRSTKWVNSCLQRNRWSKLMQYKAVVDIELTRKLKDGTYETKSREI